MSIIFIIMETFSSVKEVNAMGGYRVPRSVSKSYKATKVISSSNGHLFGQIRHADEAIRSGLDTCCSYAYEGGSCINETIADAFFSSLESSE